MSVMYNETLYVFGGFSTNPQEVLGDFWQINIRENLVQKLRITVIDELQWSRVLLSNFGGPKSTLAGTAQEVEGKIIVFGGYKTSYTNEMFSFEISK